MSNQQLIDAVLAKAPDADPGTILELISSCSGDVNQVFRLLGVHSISSKRQSTFRVSKAPSMMSRSKHQRAIPVVDLFTPEQVEAAGVFCTLHTNILEHSLANQVLSDLLTDSAGWNRGQFFLFDRQVESPHTSAAYSDDEHLLKTQNVTYQGRTVSRIVRSPPSMIAARNIIERRVNTEARSRDHKSPDWSSGFVIVNRYGNSKENVGYHSDQLTHLGPQPVIAGLSLGCTREFRLKSRIDKTPTCIYSVHLPHNSLLIMHAGCQELYKHCIAPARAVSLHPLSGTVRISLTYRMYPEDFRTERLPKCRCGDTMILRSSLEQNYRYLWQCGRNYNDNTGCGEIRYVDFGLDTKQAKR